LILHLNPQIALVHDFEAVDRLREINQSELLAATNILSEGSRHA
jgi:hypothetical protein